MKFELHFLEPVCYVFVVDSAYVDCPGVGVVGRDIGGTVGGVDRFGDGAEYYEAIDE